MFSRIGLREGSCRFLDRDDGGGSLRFFSVIVCCASRLPCDVDRFFFGAGALLNFSEVGGKFFSKKQLYNRCFFFSPP